MLETLETLSFLIGLVFVESVQQLDAEWIPKDLIKFKNVISISAKTNQNVDKLCLNIRELIDEIHEVGRKDNKTSASLVVKTTPNGGNQDETDEEDPPRSVERRLI